MKINMNKAVLDLDGKEVGEKSIGQLVAQLLVQSTKGDPMKFWFWAQKLYAGEALELDPSDHETLKSFIKEHETLTVLAKAQTLACFEK